jgi:hypothetical protein
MLDQLTEYNEVSFQLCCWASWVADLDLCGEAVFVGVVIVREFSRPMSGLRLRAYRSRWSLRSL